jgi:hypothetical protein
MDIRMPPGQYYVGDPCYVFNRKHWDELGAQTNWFDRSVGELNGQKMIAFGTAYGDGLYSDQNGRMYPVDAGLIGVVPVELIDDDCTFSHSPDCGHLIDFPQEFHCWEMEGNLKFGVICIDTRKGNEE